MSYINKVIIIIIIQCEGKQTPAQIFADRGFSDFVYRYSQMHIKCLEIRFGPLLPAV